MTASSRKPIVVGTGLLALDVVIADSMGTGPMLCAGGTCGNVLIALAYLGWDAYPIARLRSDAACKRIIEDLNSWDVKLEFVSLSESGSTPVVVQHIRQNGNGERSHKFSRRCPACGAWLPWYKAVKAATVPDLSPRLPNADVFYFDRTSRGAVNLAKHARESGALVVFEPSSESEPALLADALAAAHVVKVASDRLRGNEDVLAAKSPLLTIETLGAKGLRYGALSTNGRRKWKSLPAFPVKDLRDSAGAGDWCSAGIISVLGPPGPIGLASAPAAVLEAAMRRGQAMASWACRYDGARGGMYATSRSNFERGVSDIMKGKSTATERPSAPPRRSKARPVWCDCCLTST